MKVNLDPQHFCGAFQVLSKGLLYMGMNTAGLFIHYLSDRAQRQAFLETRRCIEGRVKLERENHRQVRSASTVGALIIYAHNPLSGR